MERMDVSISFLQFMAVGLPFVLLFLPVVWWMLWRIGRGDGLTGEIGAEVVEGELASLGPVRRPERIVLGIFLATAALWIAGKWLTSLLAPRITWFELTSAHFEGGVAVLAALTLMAWRSGGRQVLGFRALSRVPWETLLLLGGGFAMAAAIQKSGLSGFMSAQLAAVQGLPPFGQVLLAEHRHRRPLGRGLQHRHHRRDARRPPRRRRARGDGHHPVRGHHRLLLRLRPAGRHAAQRHRLRQRLRHHSRAWRGRASCWTCWLLSSRRCGAG